MGIPPRGDGTSRRMPDGVAAACEADGATAGWRAIHAEGERSARRWVDARRDRLGAWPGGATGSGSRVPPAGVERPTREAPMHDGPPRYLGLMMADAGAVAEAPPRGRCPERGAYVLAVDPAGLGAVAGLREGDVVTAGRPPRLGRRGRLCAARGRKIGERAPGVPAGASCGSSLAVADAPDDGRRVPAAGGGGWASRCGRWRRRRRARAGGRAGRWSPRSRPTARRRGQACARRRHRGRIVSGCGPRARLPRSCATRARRRCWR
jgi:hypothetical protein